MRFSELSITWQALVRRAQMTNFGELADIEFSKGEPVQIGGAAIEFDSHDDWPHWLLEQSDYELKSNWLKMIALVKNEPYGFIPRMKIQKGLPTQFTYHRREPAATGERK